MKKAELLSPAGSFEKLESAFHFGADAVYLGGRDFGLRAYAENFSSEEINEGISFAHALGKKVYVTVNIFAKNADFGALNEYLARLESYNADAVIVTDIGVIDYIRKNRPGLDIHVSTQANTLNKYAAAFYKDMGVKRVVLARELSLDDIKEIKDYVGDELELEAFIHGAMCISYSGRCLLSNYLSARDANRGECVQACRWQYKIVEAGRPDAPLTVEQDNRGTYILNSRDLNTIDIIDKIIDAGVSSLKIEGRVKSEYYVGTVTRAYRRRIDEYLSGKPFDPKWAEELVKVSHRDYTRGFFLGNEAEVNLKTSKQVCDWAFCALVLGYDEERGAIIVEQRNRFYEGERLEIVSNEDAHCLVADEIYDEEGNRVSDCKLVTQKLYIKSNIHLKKFDMLRKYAGGK